MRRKTCCQGTFFFTFTILTVVLLVLAIALAVEYSAITHRVQRQIDESVTLEKGHATFEQLREPTLPFWKDFYFFNLTNPEGFQAGEMPNLTQIGPYSYRETRTKFLYYYNIDLTLITYNQSKIFHFDNSKSGKGLREDDTICTINLPLITAIIEAEEYDKKALLPIAKFYLKEFIFKETDAKLYVCQPARALAWNYTDSLVEALHTNSELKKHGLAYPSCCVNLQVNASSNDSVMSTIHTGVGDIHSIGEFEVWDGKSDLGIWPNASANMINGTEGLFFRPNLGKGDSLQAFVDDVVRSFDLHQQGSADHLGLKTWHYVLDSTTFLSPKNYPPNARWGNWEYDGLIYLGVTRYPVVPVYGSKPHFLDGDPALREKVSGMHPNLALHDTDIDVEVYTGANIQFRRQLQLNVKAEYNDYFDQTAHLNGTLYYPLLYVNEHAELTESFKHYLESKGLEEVLVYHKAYWPVVGVLFFLSVVTGFMSIVLCYCFTKTLRSKSPQEPRYNYINVQTHTD